MTEAEWLACSDPSDLVGYMGARVSARKVRLSMCGCLRSSRVWPLLTAPASRRAVEVGEAYVEGSATLRQFSLSRKQASAAAGREWRKQRPNLPAVYLANYVCLQDRNLLTFLHLPTGYLKQLRPPTGVIRDVIGNPFRRPTSPSAWLATSVITIARAASLERDLPSGELDLAHLAVLADALEEAGCTDGSILDHLRGPGPHVRGCWVIDLLLDKQ
jgi:hypothetical protein